MRRLPLIALVAALFAGTGCNELLTPDRVRELLDHPTGSVSKDSVGRATRDFFSAKRASGAQDLAFFVKNDSAASSAYAQAALAAGNDAWKHAVSLADGDIGVGDVFCAAGLATSIASFDACNVGDDCEVEFTLDSCVLRIGDGADEHARGKITFKLKNSTSSEFNRTELRLSFEDFEITQGDATADYFDGILALETTEYTSAEQERVELILSADLTQQERRVDRGILFDDGVVASTRATGGVRFTSDTTDSSASVKVELLGFVDDSDDRRDESVSLTFAAEAREIDADTNIANASLDVTGSNGTFHCTWSAADEELAADGKGHVSSAGNCVDENGETFDFSAETTSR